MGLPTEPKKEPYYCHQCKNYFYHMATGVYFLECPDCDARDPDRQETTDE